MQQAEFLKKQRPAAIPKAPKSHMTDDVVNYLRQNAQNQSKPIFAEILASLLKEPKLYLVRKLVDTVPLEVIFDLVGKTIDIQSDGGMLLSEAGFELKTANLTESQSSFENSAAATNDVNVVETTIVTNDPPAEVDIDKRKKSAGGVFLALVKKDPRITSDMLKKIFKVEEKKRKRQKRYTASLITGLSLDCMPGEAANVAMMMQGITTGEQEEEAKDSQMAATSDS